MKILLIIFILSGAGMIAIIALKVLQEKLGLLLFWPNGRQVIEKSLQEKVAKIHSFTNGFSKKSLYIFLHFVLIKIRILFAKIQMWLDMESIRLVQLIRGKQNLDMQGKASHFLHDIRSFKDKFKKKE